MQIESLRILNLQKIKAVYLVFIVIQLTISSAVFAQESCLKQICFEKRLALEQNDIPLIGIAKFEYLFVDVYTLALYGPNEALTSEAILADVPKALVFNYQYAIEKKQMVDGAFENLKDNPNINVEEFKEELDKINSWYQDVKEGDRYELFYKPEIGTSLSYNGILKGTIPGAKFAAAYFGIWLSDKPLSKSLRDSLFEGLKK